MNDKLTKVRLDNELPEATKKWGWKYHHTGIPTQIKMSGEEYLPHLKFYVSGFSTSPFGIEWMRFDADCPLHEIIKTVPHIAFEVDDIDKELEEHGFDVISMPDKPSEGVRTAIIMHNGAPIELIEFD